MTGFMLDTNTVSHILKGQHCAVDRLSKRSIQEVCISAVTEGELLFGLAKRPDATRLHMIVKEFLRHVEIMPWDSAAAATYGSLRAGLESTGKTVGSLDLLIAANALSLDCILATSDGGFDKIDSLKSENWAS